MKAGIINRLITYIIVMMILISCQEKEFISLSGKTMGTYYSIQYSSDKNYQNEIDSILQGFIAAASTYDSTSELSEFNRRGIVYFRSTYLYKMLTMARTINKQTHGAFEPTLMPLINAHGFGPSKKKVAMSSVVDSLLSLISFSYVKFDSVKMWALKKGVQLDLSAMGEGFVIELIADFLEKNRITDYKIEIGGEVKCNGTNPNDKHWLIGIEYPSPIGRNIMKSVQLENESISTSGSYRNFYIDGGKRQSHLIDPKTGNPVQNNLLSVTIKTKNATRADAFATACMIMGFKDARHFIEDSKVEAFITYEEKSEVLSWHSAGFFTKH